MLVLRTADGTGAVVGDIVGVVGEQGAERLGVAVGPCLHEPVEEVADQEQTARVTAERQK